MVLPLELDPSLLSIVDLLYHRLMVLQPLAMELDLLLSTVDPQHPQLMDLRPLPLDTSPPLTLVLLFPAMEHSYPALAAHQLHLSMVRGPQ